MHRFKKIRVILSFWAIALWMILFMALVFVLAFTLPVYTKEWEEPPIQGSVNSPKYLSANEKETIQFVVKNTDPTKEINVLLCLDAQNPSLGILASEGTASSQFYSGSVQSLERKYPKLDLLFRENIQHIIGNFSQSAELSLWGNIGQSPMHKITDLEIMVAPVPWIKACRNRLLIAWWGMTAMLFTRLSEWPQKVKKAVKNVRATKNTGSARHNSYKKRRS